jgi:uncharacterized membrane protein YkvA (DUF1232 family)
VRYRRIDGNTGGLAMRITFELDPAEVDRFYQALDRAQRLVDSADECDIVEAAKQALDTLPIGAAPSYVRKRLAQVQRLILMLEDEDWALPRSDRDEVLRALVYFSDPDDLISDDVAVIGLLDDAIMLELLVRRMRHALAAYDDFCARRNAFGAKAAHPEERHERAVQLARCRARLHARMQRRAGAAL